MSQCYCVPINEHDISLSILCVQPINPQTSGFTKIYRKHIHRGNRHLENHFWEYDCSYSSIVDRIEGHSPGYFSHCLKWMWISGAIFAALIDVLNKRVHLEQSTVSENNLILIEPCSKQNFLKFCSALLVPTVEKPIWCCKCINPDLCHKDGKIKLQP